MQQAQSPESSLIVLRHLGGRASHTQAPTVGAQHHPSTVTMETPAEYRQSRAHEQGSHVLCTFSREQRLQTVKMASWKCWEMDISCEQSSQTIEITLPAEAQCSEACMEAAGL